MSEWRLPQITAKDIIKMGQIEAGEAPTGEWRNSKNALNCWCIPGAMVEMCPVHVNGKDPIYEDSVELAVTAELDRCAVIASDACLEQDDAGHPHNSNTWLAACAWIRMRIIGEEPKCGMSPADLIRESERERCAKIADGFYKGKSDCGHDVGCCQCANKIAAQIRNIGAGSQ